MELGPILTPVRDLGEYIREQRTAAQISLRALASKAGVSNPYLSQVERGLRRPSAGILSQIAQGLSISTESLLIRAGILQAADAPPVVYAIRADESLSERQKSALIDIYQAFRAESAAEGSAAEGSAAAGSAAESWDSGAHGAAAKQSLLRASTTSAAGSSASTSISKSDRKYTPTTRARKPTPHKAPTTRIATTRIATTRTATTRTSTTQPSHTGPAEEGNDHVATH